jgi:uncharacterized membrane protein YkoI
LLHSTVGQGIGEHEAKEIARRFFEQHYSVSVEGIILDDGIWQVEIILTAFGQQNRKVEIDAETGKIVNIV